MKNQITRGTWPLLFSAIAVGLAAQAASAGELQTQGSASPFALVQKPLAPARPLLRRHRPLAKPMTAYTIDDVVTVPNTISGSTVVAFNNTGQMLGQGYARNAWSCLVYDNGQIVVARRAAMTYCQPHALSNSNGGFVSFVGYANIARSQNSVAMDGTENGGVATIRLLEKREPSQLDEVNDLGVSIGTGYYEPRKGFFEANPPFVLANNKFAPLQPQCATRLAGCVEQVVGDYDASSGNCPFGGCAITNGNVVLGIDDYTDQLMIYTIGNPASALDTPVSWSPAYPAGINNQNVIAYAYYNPSALTYDAYEFLAGGSEFTPLGTLPGYSCQGYFPISLNNNGAVLGFTYNCASNPGTYWTWDPTNGMQDLGAEIPPNSYTNLTPLGINDAGDVLLNLTASDGTNHWGMLAPQGSGSVKTRGAHGQPHRLTIRTN